MGILLTVPVCRGIDWIVFSNSIEVDDVITEIELDHYFHQRIAFGFVVFFPVRGIPAFDSETSYYRYVERRYEMMKHIFTLFLNQKGDMGNACRADACVFCIIILFCCC
ncbi:MAG: hypothetical protein ACLTZT_02185 [Butyricimonas faecalis]